MARLVSVFLFGLLIATGFGLFGFVPAVSANHETVDWSRYWAPPFDPRNQFFPSVVTDQQGGLYFFQFDQNPSNGNLNVTVAKYVTRGASGNPERQFSRVVNPTMPNVVGVGNPYFFIRPPSAAMDHNGNLYVAWANTSQDIYVSKSPDSGLTWGAPTRVDSQSPDYNDYVPAIVAVPNGDLYVVWLQIWSVGNLRSLAVARSTDAGLTWIGRTNITTGADYWTHYVAADSLGRLHLVYTSYFAGPDSQANYTRSDDGTTWSTAIRLDGGTRALYPVIAADASDRVHVLWYDGRQSTSGTDTYWYRRSDDRGATWTMEVPVSQGRYPTGGSIVPTLAVHGDTVIAGWYVFTGVLTLGYATSPDGGDLWFPERAAEFGTSANAVTLAADENGTFYAGFYYFGGITFDIGYSIWDGPPSVPTITGVARGTGRLTVSWAGSPEGDVAGYRLWRSSDGVAYELAGTFDSTTRSYADSGLADGVYWYRVTSFDSRGTSSHPSDPMSASVGQSLAEELADLQAQLAALEDQNSAEAAALRARIDDLEGQLNAIQAEKATQAQSLLNTILLVIVILLLVFMFLQSRRRSTMAPQMPVQPMTPAPPMSQPWQPPPTPPTSPQPSKPPQTDFPEEDL